MDLVFHAIINSIKQPCQEDYEANTSFGGLITRKSVVQIQPPLPNDFKGLLIFHVPCFLLSSNNLLTHPAMIQIIPCSGRKVHHEVAADRSTASLPSTAQFGCSAPNRSKENDRTKAGLAIALSFNLLQLVHKPPTIATGIQLRL